MRDRILRRESKDLDIVCVGSGITLAKAVAEELSPSPRVTYFKRFGTAMLKYQDLEVEFVGARRESYNNDSRKPIVEDGTIEDDQNRRDFTINALAVSLGSDSFGAIIDPFEGVMDLKNRVIRTPLEPGITFSDDPLRMMRAIRFSTQLDFEIDTDTYKAISDHKDRLAIVSYERIIGELEKIIRAERPSIGFKKLYDTRLLALFLPELVQLAGVEYVDGHGHKDNFYHTLQVLDNLAESSDNYWLRWSAILHDIGKPKSKRFQKDTGWTFHGHEVIGARMVPKVFKRLKLPLDQKMKYVQKLVAMHQRPISLTKAEVNDSAIRRLIFEAGEDLDDLLLLCTADITSKNPDRVKKYHQNYEYVKQRIEEVEEKDRIRNWQPPISGDMIMKTFDIPPSKVVGIIKTDIREAILDGEIPNEYEAAYQLMLKKGNEMGLKRVEG